jgi:hypothetical protein
VKERYTVLLKKSMTFQLRIWKKSVLKKQMVLQPADFENYQMKIRHKMASGTKMFSVCHEVQPKETKYGIANEIRNDGSN